jgi:putative redox protein
MSCPNTVQARGSEVLVEIDVRFEGNKRVSAAFDGFTVLTDQPVSSGGDGSAPGPFDLFLASLATCAGYFMLAFMQKREIATEGAGVRLRTERDSQTHMVTKVAFELQLPPGFPEKYRDVVVRAVDQCTVKRHIVDPPAFEVTTRSA